MGIPAAIGLGLAGAGIISNIITGNRNAEAQEQANRLNEQLTREGWARDDTAIARRVQDLRNSGLNPVLAAGQGAATGGAIKVADPVKYADPIESVKSGAAAAQGLMDMDRTAASIDLMRSQGALTFQNARIAKHDADEIEKGRDPRNRSNVATAISALSKVFDKIPSMQRFKDQPMIDMNQLARYRDIARKNGYSDAEFEAYINDLGKPAWVNMLRRLSNKNQPSPVVGGN